MPIKRDAFFSLLGIVMRAGQLTFGEDGVRKAIASGSAALVLLDAGASDNTRKRMRDSCVYYGVPLLETQEELSEYALWNFLWGRTEFE